MKLKSFGCSFIFGTDLADDGSHLPVPTPSNHTWPAHLAKHLGYSYECHARPGGGNLQIAERILSNINDGPEFLVIGWTWIDRFDYTTWMINNNPVHAHWSNWRTLRPTDNSDLSYTYYSGLHSEFKDKLCSLINIKLIIDTLNQKRIPFVMTYMDELLFDQKWHHTPAVSGLQNFIRPYMTQFEGLSFLDWSRLQGFEESETRHPLEEAHRAGADLIIKSFDKQKTVDPTQPVLF